MLHILTRLCDAERPALAIHDSLVVRKSDAAFTKKMMVDVYWQFFGFPPVIK
jgi:hypothetical protein